MSFKFIILGVNAFFTSLANAKLEDNYIEFENELTIPFGLHPKVSIIQIRQCYKELFEMIFSTNYKQEIEQEDFKNTNYCCTVKGIPGIGKTMFIYYMLKRFLDEKINFLFQPMSTNAFYVVYDKERIFISSQSFEMHEYALDRFYLIDGQRPSFLTNKAILVCSQREEYYKELEKKPAVKKYYMPEWSKEELQSLFNKLNQSTSQYSDIKQELLDNLYKLWGGVPRFTIETVEDLTQRDLASQNIIHDIEEKSKIEIEMTILKTDLKKTLYMQISLTTVEAISAKIIHFNVGKNYQFLNNKFASDYIRNKCIEHMATESKHDISYYIENSQKLPDPQIKQYLAKIFEEIVHTILSVNINDNEDSVTYKAQLLGQENLTSIDITFNKSKFIYLEDECIKNEQLFKTFMTQELTKKNNYIYCKMPKDFPAIDALYIDNSEENKEIYLIQITCAGKKHEISANINFKTILDYALEYNLKNKKGFVKFLFVLSNVKPKFSKQAVKVAQKSQNESEEDFKKRNEIKVHIESAIEQYVLII